MIKVKSSSSNCHSYTNTTAAIAYNMQYHLLISPQTEQNNRFMEKHTMSVCAYKVSVFKLWLGMV